MESETIYTILMAMHASSVSLGVGASTLAIASFFVSIGDGVIDKAERKMLGVIYIVLRVAMIYILLLTLALSVWFPYRLEGVEPYLWILIVVLFANAALMTIHKMPPQFGPAIQAATWYTLGFIATLHLLGTVVLTPAVFVSLYVIDLFVALIAVNMVMRVQKDLRDHNAN